MSSTGDLLEGRYRLGSLLGRGAMSDVFRAVDELSGGDVAVKIVRSPDPEYARRLAQEAQALRRFEHPGLVRLLDTGVTGDMAYLVMEFVEGSSLAQALDRGPLSTSATAALGQSLADALAYVHEQGVVHRDVKPANILLGTDDSAHLADFGIARIVDSSTLTLSGTMLGTATYMAPEQLEDHAVGPGADVWSLGIVLLECLTGERVFAGTPSEVIARRLVGPVPLPDALPVPWKVLLNGMLAHEPSDRLRASEVAAMLATPVFSAPWTPVIAAFGDIATTVTRRAGSASVAHDGGTMIVPPNISALGRRSGADVEWRVRKWRLAALIALVVVVAALALAFGLGAFDGPAPTTTIATTTTEATTTTTTTTIPTAPHALAKLINDLVAGESAHSVGSQTGQLISQGAQQAVTDLASGNANQAASDLQQVATTIADAATNKYLTPAEATLLQGDLTTLATALGLSAAATPSTSTTAAAPPGPGNGNGKGNGNAN